MLIDFANLKKRSSGNKPVHGLRFFDQLKRRFWWLVFRIRFVISIKRIILESNLQWWCFLLYNIRKDTSQHPLFKSLWSLVKNFWISYNSKVISSSSRKYLSAMTTKTKTLDLVWICTLAPYRSYLTCFLML